MGGTNNYFTIKVSGTNKVFFSLSRDRERERPISPTVHRHLFRCELWLSTHPRSNSRQTARLSSAFLVISIRLRLNTRTPAQHSFPSTLSNNNHSFVSVSRSCFVFCFFVFSSPVFFFVELRNDPKWKRIINTNFIHSDDEL